MNMNEDQHHDSERGKLRASLNWLIAKAFCDKIPTLYTDLFLEDAKGLWYLKPQVVRALTSGELYCAACTHLFADKEAAWTDHSLVLSHLWQRRGVRAVERGGQPVLEAVLKRDSPFHTAAHLGLVDAIMRAYVSQSVDLPGLMREIGHFYPFPGPEVPPAVAEGLDLWMSSVAETLLERRVPLRDPNQRQAKVCRLVEEMRFPTRLACLLRFYSSGRQEAGDLIGSSALQDLTAVDAHCDLILDYCRRLRPTGLLHVDRNQLAKATLSDSSSLRPNLLCLLAELFLLLPPQTTDRRASLPPQQQQAEMPNFHLSTRLNTRVGSPGPNSSVFRLRDSESGGSDDGRRSRGNSLPQEAQLGALFFQQQRQTSPRPSTFAEPLIPAALRPSKERLTPEVSKAVESGETNGTGATDAQGFRARFDSRSPISAGTYRLPKSRSRDVLAPADARRRSGGSDDEFTTPNEEPLPSSVPAPAAPVNDGRMTFAQFLNLQRQQKEAEEARKDAREKSALPAPAAESLPPLPPGSTPGRSLKEEFERKRKERGGQSSSPAPVKRTSFAPLPNQTTWAAQQRRRQSEGGSVDGRESGGESERGSSSSLHLLPNFTDTKIRIEQKKRQIKADLKRADAKLRQMREEENKKIFQQMCMQKSTGGGAGGPTAGRKEETEKEAAVEKDKSKEKEEEKEHVEEEAEKVEQEQQPSAEVVRLQAEVESMRQEKEGLKDLLMQLQRQQDSFQQQQQQQLAQIQQRHLEQQQQMQAKQTLAEEQLKQQRVEQERERQRLQLEQELVLARAQQQQQALELERQRQRLQQQQMEQQLEMELERDRLRQSLASQAVVPPPPQPPRSESPVPSEGALSGGSQPDYNNLYDRFNQSLSELQQDISKLSLQQEFMNQTIKERLQESKPEPEPEPPSDLQPEMEPVARAAWASPAWPVVPAGMPGAYVNGTGPPVREPTPPPQAVESAHSAEQLMLQQQQQLLQQQQQQLLQQQQQQLLQQQQQLLQQQQQQQQQVATPKPVTPPPEDASTPAAFFVSFGGEEGKGKPAAEKPPRRRPKKSVDSSSTTSTESAASKTSTPAPAPVAAPAPAPVPAPVPVPPAAAFVLEESQKGQAKEELNKRKERFIALQKRKLAEREAERQEKWEMERERERMLRVQEKEMQDARKAREREKRDRVFQNYLEKKARDEEEAKPMDTRRPRPSRPPTHSPAASPISGTPTRMRHPATVPSPSSAVRRTASAHAQHTPSPLSLDLPSDGPESGGLAYEYRGIGPATVRLSSATHSPRPSAGNREPVAAAAEYNGPRLFKQPKERSNRSVIVNAINHCLLPGTVNKEVRSGVLEDLQKAEGSTFMVLFRNRSCQYRGLYSFHQESEELTRFAGSGPKKVRNNDVVDFFKYDSGAKKFSRIDTTKHLSPVIDAFTIDNKLWKKGGTRPSGQVASTSAPATGSGYASRRH